MRCSSSYVKHLTVYFMCVVSVYFAFCAQGQVSVTVVTNRKTCSNSLQGSSSYLYRPAICSTWTFGYVTGRWIHVPQDWKLQRKNRCAGHCRGRKEKFAVLPSVGWLMHAPIICHNFENIFHGWICSWILFHYYLESRTIYIILTDFWAFPTLIWRGLTDCDRGRMKECM